MFSALFPVFAEQYQVSFYKIKAELKGEVGTELIKSIFDKNVESGNYEFLGMACVCDGVTATITNTKQTSYPESYNSDGLPSAWFAYDTGFVSELTSLNDNGKLSLTVMARFNEFDGWQIYKARGFDILKPKFSTRETATSLFPKFDIPILLIIFNKIACYLATATG